MFEKKERKNIKEKPKEKPKEKKQKREKSIQRQIKILEHLRKDGRKKISHIAQEEGLSNSTAHEHFTNAQKFVLRNTSLLNFEKLGYPHRVSVIFSELSEKESHSIQKKLLINNLFSIHKGLIADILFENIEEQEETLLELSEKYSIETYNILEIVCEEKWFPEIFSDKQIILPKK